MLGVMFSGRHDLETMQCKDGSFFIDRDGTHFRHILNYLRDGEEAIESIPNSPEVLLELFREAIFYQLDSLASLLKPILRESVVVNQNQIAFLFFSGSGTYYTDYGRNVINVNYHSKDKIKFKHKNMKKLCFSYMRFVHAVSFVNCDLTSATFQHVCFESDTIFEDCILDGTMFNNVKGLVSNSFKVTFTGSKTDKTNFDSNLRSSLQSSGTIP